MNYGKSAEGEKEKRLLTLKLAGKGIGMGRNCVFSCLLLAVMLAVTGCGGKENLSTDMLKDTTVLIRSDGSMEQYIVENFNKSYYNLKDLKAFAKEKVEEYNDLYKENPISLEWVRTEDKLVTMLLSYASVEDFAQFNSQKASFMTVAEARKEGILPETLYSSGKDKEIPTEEAKLTDEWFVFSLDADSNIQITGEMKYYQNAALLNPVSIQAKEGKMAVVIFK